MKAEHFPKIEDKLRLFIACVDHDRTPPPWLLHFMADGAAEFLRGGRPWQKGKGGRPKVKGQKPRIAFLLSEVGNLKPSEIADLIAPTDADGADRAKSIRRWIEKGKGDIAGDFNALPPFGLQEMQYWFLRDTLAEVLCLDLPPDAARRARQLQEQMQAFETEMEEEPDYGH